MFINKYIHIMVHVVASGMLDKPLLELSSTAVLILSIIINILLSWLAIAIDFFNTSDQACIGKSMYLYTSTIHVVRFLINLIRNDFVYCYTNVTTTHLQIVSS